MSKSLYFHKVDTFHSSVFQMEYTTSMNGTNVHNIIYHTVAFIHTYLELTDGTAITLGHATTAPQVRTVQQHHVQVTRTMVLSLWIRGAI